MINEKDVLHAAKLAKIKVTETESGALLKDMQSIIALADMLGEADTNGVELTYHTIEPENAFRKDVVTNAQNRENLLQNAPAEKDGYFTVPKGVNA